MPEDDHLVVRVSYGTEPALNAKEQSIAQWVYDLGQLAGLGTDTLPFSDAVYVPLLASQGPIGVLRVRPIQSKRLFSPEQMHLLESCANQIAIGIGSGSITRTSEKIRITNRNRSHSYLLYYKRFHMIYAHHLWRSWEQPAH